MNGPIDVLAVFDEAASWLPHDGEDNRISERFTDARDAVAELIEAIKAERLIVRSFTRPTIKALQQATERTDDATARVGAK